jgi:hypothetical protein
MYDPTVGRWISADPIGFKGKDKNLYRYVMNSPIISTDPLGLQGDGIVDSANTISSGWNLITTTARFAGDPYNGQNNIDSRVDVTPFVDHESTAAHLEIVARARNGKDTVRWPFWESMGNWRGARDYPAFLAVVLQSTYSIDGQEQPTEIRTNIHPDFVFRGATTFYPPHDRGPQFFFPGAFPVTWEPYPVTPSDLEDGRVDLQEDIQDVSITFKHPNLKPNCSGEGNVKIWYVYSDSLWASERRKVFGDDKSTYQAYPGLMIGYEVQWSYDPTIPDFNVLELTTSHTTITYGNDNIEGITGIDFFDLMKRYNGYDGYDKPPVMMPHPAEPPAPY